MKKLLLPFMVFLFAAACKKEDSQELFLSNEIASSSASSTKIDVCHYDATTGKSTTISISENAWPAHQAHGDLLGDCSEVITTICGRDWTVRNLDVDTYRNGDPIPQVTDPSEWANLTSGAWCYYNNDPINGSIYGKLYNLYAVADPRGIAPPGWHVPTRQEWEEFGFCLDPNYQSIPEVVGGKLLEPGKNLWLNSPFEGATNSTGFTALPSGWRNDAGYFEFLGLSCNWWGSTLYIPNDPIGGSEVGTITDYGGFFVGPLPGAGRNGLSIRLIRD